MDFRDHDITPSPTPGDQYTEVNFGRTDSHDISSQEKKHFLLSNENFV